MNAHQTGGCKRVGGVLLAALVILPLCALLSVFGVWMAGRFLVVSDDLQHADTAVVLSGGGTDRVDEAVRIIQAGYTGYLIITDTDEITDSGRRMTDYLFSEAANRGLAVPQIDITEHTAASTLDEARAVRLLMEERGWTSCIVVTDPFHSRRTKIIFQDAFRNSGLSVQVRSVEGHWYNPSRWFLSGSGWATTLQEYAKLLAYWAGVD